MLIWVMRISYDHEDQIFIEHVGPKQPNMANKGQLMRSNKTNTRIFLPFLLCNGVYDMKGIFKPLTN